MQKQTFLKTDYLGILIDENIDIVKKSPLRIKALRKAINYGFDRVKMVKFLEIILVIRQQQVLFLMGFHHLMIK